MDGAWNILERFRQPIEATLDQFHSQAGSGVDQVVHFHPEICVMCVDNSNDPFGSIPIHFSFIFASIERGQLLLLEPLPPAPPAPPAPPLPTLLTSQQW